MNKKLFSLAAFSLICTIVLMSFSSAYHYGNHYSPYDNYFDSYSYTLSRNLGYVGGPIYSNTKTLSKTSTSGFTYDGRYHESTVYVRTNTYPPNYYGYNHGYDYFPSYRKYWNYGNYPTNYHRFDYLPHYRYGYY